jgi:hypothetical protein
MSSRVPALRPDRPNSGNSINVGLVRRLALLCGARLRGYLLCSGNRRFELNRGKQAASSEYASAGIPAVNQFPNIFFFNEFAAVGGS